MKIKQLFREEASKKKKKVQNENGRPAVTLYGLGAKDGICRQSWFGIEFCHCQL